jgi:hypothetical protein
MSFQTDKSDRIAACLSKQSRLTMGEVELLHAIGDRKEIHLSQLDEQELRQIERKLGLA